MLCENKIKLHVFEVVLVNLRSQLPYDVGPARALVQWFRPCIAGQEVKSLMFIGFEMHHVMGARGARLKEFVI